MGNRADLSALKDKKKKCIVEATFKIDSYHLQHVLRQMNLIMKRQRLLEEKFCLQVNQELL